MAGKECIAMLLAGGQGSRLGALTKDIAKPAVSFGGKYRIIDFALSNCINSDIDTVGVLTQYRPLKLNHYIGTGAAWDLDSPFGGVNILPPYATETGGAWYNGTADAVYHNIDFIDSYEPEHVLILSGDHLYKMDYKKMLQVHEKNKADLTVSVIEVPWAEASRFGIMATDKKDRITEFAEKPAEPKSNLASMGIYIFKWSVLRKELMKDHDVEDSDHDFGKNIIPNLLAQKKKLFAYHFEGYWKDVGTIDSYYEAHMDILDNDPVTGFDIFDPEWRIFSNTNLSVPHYMGPKAVTQNSLICNGCVIDGEIKHSILAPDTIVKSGSTIKDSLLLPGVQIGKNCKLIRTIVNEGIKIKDDQVIGSKDGPITVVGKGSKFVQKG